MSPEDIANMYQEVSRQIPQQADASAAEIAQQTAAMAPAIAEIGGAGGQGLGQYNYNRLVRPAVQPLQNQLTLQGRQQALRQGIYDETQSAQERYDEAQRNYRQRQREAAERARREAEAARQAAMRAYSRGGGGGSGGSGGGGAPGGQVGGVNVTPTSTQRSPSLSGAEQMFRAENPALFTAGRLIQPAVPQALQNMTRQAVGLYPLARLAGTFLGAR